MQRVAASGSCLSSGAHNFSSVKMAKTALTSHKMFCISKTCAQKVEFSVTDPSPFV